MHSLYVLCALSVSALCVLCEELYVSVCAECVLGYVECEEGMLTVEGSGECEE